MARKPTIKDVAREAGVGVATVDRVLNGRPNVSERAAVAVAEAIERLGYGAKRTHKVSPGARKLTLGFVLHKAGQAFYRSFAREIEAACRARTDVTITPVIRFAASQGPEDFATEIRAQAGSCSAIAASAVNHPALSRLAGELTSRGIPVFSVLNDFTGSSGAGYFGLDNMKVGRLAASILAMRLQRACKCAVFVGGSRWHGQALRETGFRSYMRKSAPRIDVIETVVNLETRQLTYEATLELLERHGDLAGIYVAGGGMEGAIAALREARPPGKVALVVNELTPESRDALADGYALMVIATPLPQLCEALVERMVRSADAATRPAPIRPLTPLIYLPESF